MLISQSFSWHCRFNIGITVWDVHILHLSNVTNVVHIRPDWYPFYSCYFVISMLYTGMDLNPESVFCKLSNMLEQCMQKKYPSPCLCCCFPLPVCSYLLCCVLCSVFNVCGKCASHVGTVSAGTTRDKTTTLPEKIYIYNV
jgi:hypothetical protein